MISLTYIEPINLCVLCVFVVRSSRSLAGIYLIKYILPTKPKRADRRQKTSYWTERGDGMLLFKADSPEAAESIIGQHPLANSSGIGY
nr:hypothetical protein [Microcystis sp. M049S2]